MSEEHRLVIVRWYDDHGSTELTCRDVTKAEALKRAQAFGYVKPKWYQIFRPAISFEVHG